jgi:hypothetical protein
MEPSFQRGDLVIAREQAEYVEDEIVVYQHPEIGPVFHRIIDETDGVYSFQGDNNGWVDSYKAGEDEIMGSYAFKFPVLGQTIANLRSPDNLILFSVGASVLIVASVMGDPSPQKNERKKLERAMRGKRSSFSFPLRLQDILIILIGLSALALIFGIIAFQRPSILELPSTSNYEHVGTFEYSATVPSSVYDSTTLEAGEPLFRRISDRFKVNFDYALEADSIEAVNGSYRVVAELSVINGWKRTLVLADEIPFNGERFEFETEVDLNALQSLIDVFTLETGISPSVYLIDIGPDIALQGLYQAEEWSDSFSPRVRFRASELLVELVNEGEDTEFTLQEIQGGNLADTLNEDNTISVFGATVKIQNARLLALGLFILFAGASIYTALRVNWYAKQPEVERIAGLYGRLIVPVSRKTTVADDKIVDVGSMEDLIRLSQQEGRSILMEKKNKYVHYYVHALLVSYHYRIRL